MNGPQPTERVTAQAWDDVEQIACDVFDLIGPPPGWTPPN